MQIHSFSPNYSFKASYGNPAKTTYYSRPEPTRDVPQEIQEAMDSLPNIAPANRSDILNKVGIFLKNHKEYDGRALIDIAIANVPDENLPNKIRRDYAWDLRRLAEYANCDEEKKEEVSIIQKNILNDCGITQTRDWFAPTSCNVLGVRVPMNEALGETETRRSRRYNSFKDK